MKRRPAEPSGFATGLRESAAMRHTLRGGQPVPQFLRLFDAENHEMIAEVPLRADGQPGNGNFGVLIHDGMAYVSEPGRGTIRMFDLDSFGESDPEVLASSHESPDGLAWSPLRVEVMN